eukprot:TRINITY_DN1770_c0_g1_i2.p1 TRINITY_DN1770_c0_g1~~TRINITY_DN1770_c0_g1_i2.p1  ORF type:complete len:1620 (-),score=545.91 TRINITY_DN1770_c0_g1_i2:25-4314(-)
MGDAPIDGLDIVVSGMTKSMKRIIVLVPSLYKKNAAPYNTFGEGHKAFLVTLKNIRKGVVQIQEEVEDEIHIHVQSSRSDMIDKMKKLGATSFEDNNQNQLALSQPSMNQNQGGFNNQPSQQGGFNQPNQQGFSNQMQGGFNQNQPNQQGGYNNQIQGGFQQPGFPQYQQQGGYMGLPSLVIQQTPPPQQYQPPPPPAPSQNTDTKGVVNLLVEEKTYKNQIIGKLDVISTKMDRVQERLNNHVPERPKDSNVNGISAKALLQTVKRIVIENDRLVSDTDSQTSRINKLQNQVNELLEKNRKIVEENNKYAQQRNHTYQSQSNEYKKLQDQLRDEKENLQIELADAHTKLNTAKRKFEVFKEKYTRLADEYKNTLSSLERETEKRKNLQISVDNVEAELNDVKTNLQLSQRNLELVQQDLFQSQKDLNLYMQRCEKLREQLDENTKKAREELNLREKNWQEEKSSWESRIDTLKDTLQHERVAREQEKQRMEEEFLQRERTNSENMMNTLKKQHQLQLEETKEKWEEQKNNHIENLLLEAETKYREKEETLRAQSIELANEHYERGINEARELAEQRYQEYEDQIDALKNMSTPIEENTPSVSYEETIKKTVVQSIEIVYSELLNIFDEENEYSGKYVLETLKQTLVQTTSKQLKYLDENGSSTSSDEYDEEQVEVEVDTPSKSSAKEASKSSTLSEGATITRGGESSHVSDKKSTGKSKSDEESNKVTGAESSEVMDYSPENEEIVQTESKEEYSSSESDTSKSNSSKSENTSQKKSASALSSADETPATEEVIPAPVPAGFGSLSSLSDSSEDKKVTTVAAQPETGFSDIFGEKTNEFDFSAPPPPNDFPFSESSGSDDFAKGLLSDEGKKSQSPSSSSKKSMSDNVDEQPGDANSADEESAQDKEGSSSNSDDLEDEADGKDDKILEEGSSSNSDDSDKEFDTAASDIIKDKSSNTNEESTEIPTIEISPTADLGDISELNFDIEPLDDPRSSRSKGPVRRVPSPRVENTDLDQDLILGSDVELLDDPRSTRAKGPNRRTPSPRNRHDEDFTQAIEKSEEFETLDASKSDEIIQETVDNASTLVVEDRDEALSAVPSEKMSESDDVSGITDEEPTKEILQKEKSKSSHSSSSKSSDDAAPEEQDDIFGDVPTDLAGDIFGDNTLEGQQETVQKEKSHSSTSKSSHSSSSKSSDDAPEEQENIFGDVPDQTGEDIFGEDIDSDNKEENLTENQDIENKETEVPVEENEVRPGEMENKEELIQQETVQKSGSSSSKSSADAEDDAAPEEQDDIFGDVPDQTGEDMDSDNKEETLTENLVTDNTEPNFDFEPSSLSSLSGDDEVKVPVEKKEDANPVNITAFDDISSFSDEDEPISTPVKTQPSTPSIEPVNLFGDAPKEEFDIFNQASPAKQFNFESDEESDDLFADF